MEKNKYIRGTQIICIPSHAEGNIKHPDCERGFVTSRKGDTVFCRYWVNTITLAGRYMNAPSLSVLTELRTKAGSEGTPIQFLYIKNTVPKLAVDNALKDYC